MKTNPVPAPREGDIARLLQKIEVKDVSACWEWRASTANGGYGAFGIGNKVFKAHRVALAWLGGEDVPGDMLVCHRCDNPPCCNPSHLFIGASVDNVRDMFAKNRNTKKRAVGEANGNSKLTGEVARTIRLMREQGSTLAEIATLLSVSISAVHHVVTGRTWSHAI